MLNVPDETSADESRSDAALLGLAQRGEVAAFEALYFRHRDFVYRLAARFTGNHAATLDVSQETFAYLIKRLPTLELTGKLSTWLYPIVKNIAHTQHRKRQREVPGLNAVVDDPSLVRHAGSDSLPDQHQHLREAVANLPEAQREVVLMRIVDEMSVDEVATALNIPIGTVKSRLFHGLGTLRQNAAIKDLWEGL